MQLYWMKLCTGSGAKLTVKSRVDEGEVNFVFSRSTLPRVLMAKTTSKATTKQVSTWQLVRSF